MFQLLPVFLGLFDSTVQKLMNGFRDIFYELAYSNLSNMLSDLNEKVATISTELSTAPDAWQGGTIWELIVKIAEQVALPVAGTVFTFVVLWELISMLVQPNNLADIDFVYRYNNGAWLDRAPGIFCRTCWIYYITYRVFQKKSCVTFQE